ncbi:MAG: hypothetical protein ACK2UK_18110 [Candidatus Promineifilaceae bacterium]
MSKQHNFLHTTFQLLLVSLLGMPLISPLLRWSSVPCTHDGHLHVHRIAALRYAWENGIYFSRWVPDLAFGYGYPFFVYREPGPLYAILLPHLLGLPLNAASNLFYTVTILAAGWFMFLWVRDVAGARPGFVSAVAYMAAPYVLLDALVRGNAPESMALPLFPFLLWAGRRWIIRGTAVPFVLAVAGLALLSISHNISTLIFVPALLVYLIGIGLVARLSWPELATRLALFFVLGLGLTFFYTGGALLEMDQVTLNQSTVTRNNDFHFNFASLSEIAAPVQADDPNLLNPPLPIRLGWIPLLLGLLGATTPLWKRRMNKEQRWHIVLMLVAFLIFVLMALPLSLALWEGLPLIDFVQFPWRFIGRAALPLAFLAGMPFLAPPEPNLVPGNRRLLLNLATAVAITLLLVEAIPSLYPRYCEEEPFPSIVDVHEYEAATGLVGVDPEGSYFPRTVHQRPKGSPLLEDYRQGETPQRFDEEQLPAGATAEVNYAGFGATASISSPEPFLARYFSFAFPGWSAEVDGEAVAITPGEPDGLITFPVPAGEHLLKVRWRSTPLRSSLMLLGLLALGVIFVTTIYLSRKRSGAHLAGPLVRDTRLIWMLLLVVLGVIAFKQLLVDSGRTPLHRPGEPKVSTPANLKIAELTFAGHNLSRAQAAGGDTIDVDLAWLSDSPTDKTYQSNIWLADENGLIWSDKETYRPRLFEDGPATWEWEPGQWAWDSRELQVLNGAPPGRYDLVLTLFDRDTLQPLTFQNADESVIGPVAVIDQVEVTMPDQPPTFSPQYPLQEPVESGGVRLLGYSQDRAEAMPGDALLLTLFLERAAGALSERMEIGLMDVAGNLVHTWRLPLIAKTFDGDSWESGQRLRAQHLLRLPAALNSATYQLWLADTVPLGELIIEAPERQFAPPPADVEADISFEDMVRLTGYSVRQEDGQLLVDLVWRAEQELPIAYNVFVHLVDASGALIAQSDAQPVNWTRPTSGWAPGEYIVDSHVLSLPTSRDPSELKLLVGLYDPATGQRLATEAGDTAQLSIILR